MVVSLKHRDRTHGQEELLPWAREEADYIPGSWDGFGDSILLSKEFWKQGFQDLEGVGSVGQRSFTAI